MNKNSGKTVEKNKKTPKAVRTPEKSIGSNNMVRQFCEFWDQYDKTRSSSS